MIVISVKSTIEINKYYINTFFNLFYLFKIEIYSVFLGKLISEERADERRAV